MQSRPDSRPRAPLADRVHAALGAFPLAAYLLLHVVETWPALSGRTHFGPRLRATTTPAWLMAKALLVLLPLVVHGALGLRRALRRREPLAEAALAPYGSSGLRTLQAVTGALTAAYLAGHLAELTVPLWRGGAPDQLYETLSLRAGTPLSIAVVSVGLAAVCFHAGQGVPAALVTLGLVRRDGQLLLARVLSGLLAVAVWLALLDVASHFVVGRALFGEHTAAQPMGTVSSEDAEPED